MPDATPRMPPTWNELMRFVHSGGGLWITNLYHYAGIAVAWIGSRLGMSPNALTIGSAVLTSAGVAVIVAAAPDVGWAAALVSFALLAVGYAADCSDGQLARATGKGSALGAWLDHTFDCWKIVVTNAGLGWVAISRASEAGDPLWPAFLAPNLFIAGTALYFFGWNYKVSLAGKGSVSGTLGERGLARKLMALPLHLTDFGLFLMLWFLLPLPELFLPAYLGLAVLTFPIYLAYLVVSAWALRRVG